ncbi:EpsG family protein [Neobacillus vireti]|uniref:Capsular polysaccharide biosynthesis protein n=1 Tax=Neobacillus vireti LMG 21834 TaxID=1131730 RepID=A0AB94IKN2_9BACI|nr:EpsG family protein [Neobacillus vireti]ETI67567.1 capsular polysaccharide biosynthesis protein [Neobacillus vireti LMG 21834]KLT18483.1 capsular biosynthesis protein [Neobacillus vireti]
MAILWINFIVVYISSVLARFFSQPITIEDPYIKPNKLLIFISVASLVFISGLRTNIGDTYFYMHSYKITDFSLESLELKGDFGFNVLQALLQKISHDPQILIFTTALLTNLLIVLVLYKYSRMIELSLFVYIASGMYTVSMNGIRQTLAAAIVFAATKFIFNGNWKGFLLIVLLGSTIHQTALIFIPVYFIVRREAWTKTTFILLGVGVIIAAGFNQFSQILFEVLNDTQYGHYSNFSEGGANVLRIAVTCAPLIIAFFGKEKLREFWPKSDYIVNLALLGTVFMLISSQNWIFARFNIYFGLYNLILISWIVILFSHKDRKTIYYLLLGCYVIYFYYEQVLSLNIVYKSDFFNL